MLDPEAGAHRMSLKGTIQWIKANEPSQKIYKDARGDYVIKILNLPQGAAYKFKEGCFDQKQFQEVHDFGEGAAEDARAAFGEMTKQGKTSSKKSTPQANDDDGEPGNEEMGDNSAEEDSDHDGDGDDDADEDDEEVSEQHSEDGDCDGDFHVKSGKRYVMITSHSPRSPKVIKVAKK